MKKKKIIKFLNTLFLLYVLSIMQIIFVQLESKAFNVFAKHKETKAKILKLKFLEGRETRKLYRNQQKLEKTERNLNYSKTKYNATRQRLNQMEKELAVILSSYNESENQAKTRIRKIYKKERKGLLEFLLNSSSFADFLDRIYFQNLIVKHDSHELNVLKNKAAQIAMLKSQMKAQQAYLTSEIDTMHAQQKVIAQAIDRNQNMIEKLKTDRATYERAERELARQSEKLRKLIEKNVKCDTGVKVTSTFIKPIAGPITSPFGYRIHPIFKTRIFHSGIDIGGINGGAVRASNKGKVLYVGWYGGYGKVVIIDHGLYNGKPITTLYAHLSSWSTSVGAIVSRGQIIGREGSTGYSTGPHVHFEIRVNGKPTNPLHYI